MAVRITNEEWLRALQKAEAKNPEGLTAGEWSKRLKLNIRATREAIRDAISANLLRFNGHRRGFRMDGMPCSLPVYQVVKKSPRKG